jgi:hypothetical protein
MRLTVRKLQFLLAIVIAFGIATESFATLVTAFIIASLLLTFRLGAFWAVRHDARIARLRAMRS